MQTLPFPQTWREEGEGMSETKPPEVETAYAQGSLYIEWGGQGFGNLSIKSTPTGGLKLDTEFMGKDFAKAVICKLIDEAHVEYDESEPK